MKNTILLLVLSIVIFSCENTGQSGSEKDLKPKADSLLKEVMRIHDEVMPQTLVLEKLKKKLNLKMDSLELDSGMVLGIQNTVNSMDTAIIGMRDWMYNFEKPADSVSLKNIIEYYELQIDIMEKVKNQTFTIMPEAEDKLSELDSI
ncbi:hypothetical protein HZR84_06720 [Hyphobacterium sp. CCMP332]|nr:hypothetical protein HZR84_06720 [Hyphobacterium sp. CCMP332]